MINICIFIVLIFLLNNLLLSQGLQPFGLHDKVITSLAVEQTDYNSLIPPLDYIFAGTAEGVYKASVVNASHEWISLGIDSMPITALTAQHWGRGPVDGLRLYAAAAPEYESDDSTLIFSREVLVLSDTSWIASDSGIDKSSGGIFALNSFYYTGHTPPGQLLAGGSIGIFYEQNNFWNQSEIEAGNPYILAIDVAPHWWGNLAWAVGYYGSAPDVAPLVLRSTDKGITWRQFALADYLSASATSVAINTRNTDSVYVSCNNYIFLTPDNGGKWEDVFSSRGILINTIAVDPIHPENFFAGGFFFDDSHQSPNHGVFLYSTNGGKDWNQTTPVTDVLLEEVTSIAVFRKPDDKIGYVFIGTAGTGIWLYQYSIITGINSDKKIPEQFILFQNYPNPFNSKTHFGFRIANLGLVTLKIYDVLGNEVDVLVNEEKPADRYEIEFDGSKLSSGTYFYRLSVSAWPSQDGQSGNFISTKKMILMK